VSDETLTAEDRSTLAEVTVGGGHGYRVSGAVARLLRLYEAALSRIDLLEQYAKA
jgi:hypothetical protein